MDLQQLERFWAQHGWFMVLSPATEEMQAWCDQQFGYNFRSHRGDHTVMLFQEEEHRMRFIMVWGTAAGGSTSWHPV